MSSIDVFVPCYQYGHFLRECVESVLSQSLHRVRVLIIDDASPDDTAEVATALASRDPRVTLVRHPVNRGHIATYNEGIEWAAADYMLLLSADDYLLPGALERAASLMDAHPEVGFTFGRGVELMEDGTRVPQQGITRQCDNDTPAWRILSGLEFIELSGPRNIVCTPTAVVRTQLQKEIGGYRTELPHAGDMEMWLRLAAHASVGVLHHYQAVYRWHTANMSRGYVRRWLPDLQQRRMALETFFENSASVLPDVGRLRSRLRRELARYTVSRASSAFNSGDMEISAQLSDFAVDICPRIMMTLPWVRLACKRALGPELWHIVQPLADRRRRSERLL
jgi:GT2 family glycosyltransferase